MDGIHLGGDFWIFHAILSDVGTTADLTWGSDFVHLSRLRQRKLTTDRLVNGLSYDGIDMVIKDLDLELKKSVERASVLHQPDGVGSNRYHIVPYRELSGILVALVASINVIDEILEEDFDALLDEGSKILHSIEGTILEEEELMKKNQV
nr:hypothetical protein [Tanacetum cinerariifolium]